MKPDFGKKLEEARTRLGISIRQASDSTKIRSDFLLAFENEGGNFPMPEVYKRGFLKIYSRYLKLNVEEMQEEYIASQKAVPLKKSVKNVKEERESFGRMELNLGDTDLQTTLPLPNTEFIKAPSQSDASSEYVETKREKAKKTKREPLMLPETRALYTKIGIIFGGTLAVFTVIALFISSLLNKGSSVEENVFSAQSESVAASDNLFSNTLKSVPEIAKENLTLSVEGDVHVLVRQESDKQHLFAGNITKNKPVTISRSGPVKIHFSNGSKLLIQKDDGKKVKPGRDGVGWIEI